MPTGRNNHPGSTLAVIAPRAFQREARRLVEHKNRTGQPARFLSIEAIRNRAARSADAPLAIKRTIARLHRDHDVGYVLLAGDAASFPARYRVVFDPTRPFNAGYTSSDLYYANLYRGHVVGAAGDVRHSEVLDTWDSSGNGEYNESVWITPSPNPDAVDGYPDIAVGRGAGAHAR